MRLTKFNWRDIPNISKPNYGRNIEIINEFIDGGDVCVKVEGWKHKSAGTCATSLNESIKRLHMSSVKAISRDGDVFLIKLKVFNE